MPPGQGSQYIELPDSTPDNPSYGEFPANAADADIHRQIMVAYPDHFKDLSQGTQTIMRRSDKGNPPPAGKVPPVNMHKSYMLGDPNDDPESEDNSMLGIAKNMLKAPVNDAITMTRAGYQSMAKGLTGNRSAPLGEPPTMKEFKPAAMNTAIAMMGGLGEEVAGSSAGSASSKLVRQAESAPPPTSTPGAYGRSSGRTGTSVGGGAGTASRIAADIGDLLQPKWMKAIKLIKKHVAGPPAEEAPLPHALAGKGVFGTPADQWGKMVEGADIVHHEPVPGERTGQPFQPDPKFPRTRDFRSAPKILQRNPPLQLKGNVGTRPEPAWKSAKPDDDFEWPDNYKGGAQTLTRDEGGGANYTAEDLAALKQKHGISSDSPVSNASKKLVKSTDPVEKDWGSKWTDADEDDALEHEVKRGTITDDDAIKQINQNQQSRAASKLSKRPKVNGDIIGERTADPRTPGEPLQHGFNPKPAEDLGLKVRSDVERRQGPLPRSGGSAANRLQRIGRAGESKAAKATADQPEYDNVSIGAFGKANGTRMEAAVPKGEAGQAIANHIHSITNRELGQLANHMKVDIGGKAIGRAGVGRGEVFGKMLDAGNTPEDIVNLHKRLKAQ